MVVTLTGGIATGKSTVCKIMKDAGCKIVDVDKISQDVVQKGETAWKQIVDFFGIGILKTDGQLDRNQLGNIIFNDSLKRKELNKIVHPHVLSRTNKTIKIIHEINPNYIVIVDMPLFFEIFKHRLPICVILVYVPKHIQIERLMKRDGLNKTDALARINSQISIEEKRKFASITINNSGPLEKTKEITISVLKKVKSQIIITKNNDEFSFDT